MFYTNSLQERRQTFFDVPQFTLIYSFDDSESPPSRERARLEGATGQNDAHVRVSKHLLLVSGRGRAKPVKPSGLGVVGPRGDAIIEGAAALHCFRDVERVGQGANFVNGRLDLGFLVKKVGLLIW